jgi:hypothetical protein
VEERLSALGNVVACNDYVALVHPDLDKVSHKIQLLDYYICHEIAFYILNLEQLIQNKFYKSANTNCVNPLSGNVP